jgi:N-acylneuraminate cytidylyltransferase
MRLAADIDVAIERCVNTGAQACVSVCEPDKSPFWMLKTDSAGMATPLFPADQIPGRRQDAPPIFALNGAIFMARTDYLAHGGAFLAGRTMTYVMPKERSLDIDTELDLTIASFLLCQGQH